MNLSRNNIDDCSRLLKMMIPISIVDWHFVIIRRLWNLFPAEFLKRLSDQIAFAKYVLSMRCNRCCEFETIEKMISAQKLKKILISDWLTKEVYFRL